MQFYLRKCLPLSRFVMRSTMQYEHLNLKRTSKVLRKQGLTISEPQETRRWVDVGIVVLGTI
jgi:hypothetical protein